MRNVESVAGGNDELYIVMTQTTISSSSSSVNLHNRGKLCHYKLNTNLSAESAKIKIES